MERETAPFFMKTLDIDDTLSKLEDAARKIFLKGRKDFQNGKLGAYTSAALVRNDIMRAVELLKCHKEEIGQILNG